MIKVTIKVNDALRRMKMGKAMGLDEIARTKMGKVVGVYEIPLLKFGSTWVMWAYVV